MWLLLVVAGQLLGAAPASAHAELERTTPADGARLDRAPAEVTLRFSESVDLLDRGIRLLDGAGRVVPTPDPVADGSTVRWRMPEGLPDGGYVVSWRVISSDGHPVAGAFSFGVGAVAPAVTDSGVLPPEAPWPVVLVRFLGYLGFALVAGAVAVTVLCWPEAGRGGRPLDLLRGGLALSAVATVVGLLLQGPYAAGEPLTRLFDRSLVAETGHTDFAAWMQLRLFLVLAVAALAWARGSLQVRLNRWVALLCVVGAAVTFSGTGHAAAPGTLLARVTDSLHVLLAGVWVGGLVVLAVGLLDRAGAGTEQPGRPDAAALARFSRLALLAVAGLLATGVVNAVLRLPRWSALWDSRYGVLLLAKLALVAVVLGVAALSRRSVGRGAEPRRTITAEVAVTVVVLAVTSVLASTAPPPTGPARAAGAAPSSGSVTFGLGSGRAATLTVTPATTTGSRLRVELRTADGRPLGVRSLTLRAELPSRDVAPLEVTLHGGPATWTGRFRFPFPGSWRLTLTAELPDRTGLVTAGSLSIP